MLLYRESKNSRDIKEITREWFQDEKLDEKNITQLRALIVKGLEAKEGTELGDFSRSLELSFQPLQARDYVSYFCILQGIHNYLYILIDPIKHFFYRLDLPESIQSAACTVCEKANELNIFKGNACNYLSLAAAAVHLVCQISEEHWKKSIQSIASSRLLEDAVVTQCYDQLMPRHKEVLPSNLNFVVNIIDSVNLFRYLNEYHFANKIYIYRERKTKKNRRLISMCVAQTRKFLFYSFQI